MSNYKRLNTNTLQLGQDQGTCSIVPQTSNRIKCEMDLVKSTGANLIDYNESTNTIDFNNCNITNFTGGGGGGGGDAFLGNSQTFTAVNTFSANTVLSTVDTSNISATGTVTASGNITGATLITAGNVECNKVESVGNVEIATGDLIVTTGNCTVGGTTTVNAIATNNITTVGTIACNSSIQGASLSAAAGDITCTAGNINGLSLQSSGGQVNLKTGNARIEADTNDDTRIQANTNADTIVCRLGGTGADNLQLSFDSGTNKSVLKLYDFGASQYYNVGGSPDDLAGLIASIQNTSLTFNGSTTETFEGGLVSTGTCTLSGAVVNLGTGTNTATITCMNDTADRLNVVAGKIQLDATATLAKTGTTSGATDLFTVTDTLINRSIANWAPTKQEIVNNGTGTGTDIDLNVTSPVASISVASSVIYEQYGVNGSGVAIYKVSFRGRIGFASPIGGTTQPNINLFTLPAGIRPFIEQNFIVSAHTQEKTSRIDITTGGIVAVVASATTPSSEFVNLGSIEFWAGI